MITRTIECGCVIVGVVALVALASCSPSQSPREMCRQRREILDSLYASYGGGTGAAMLRAQPEAAGAGGQVEDAARRLALKLDQLRFEQLCDEAGRGAALSAIDEKALTFLQTPEAKAQCGRAVDLREAASAASSALPPDQRVVCE